MVYKFSLKKLPFDKIKNGTKIIESRLFDEKRKQLKVSDQIIFINSDDLNEQIETKIINIMRFKTFSELVDANSPSDFGWPTKEEVIKEIRRFYTLKDELKFSVIGIKIKK